MNNPDFVLLRVMFPEKHASKVLKMNVKSTIAQVKTDFRAHYKEEMDYPLDCYEVVFELPTGKETADETKLLSEYPLWNLIVVNIVKKESTSGTEDKETSENESESKPEEEKKNDEGDDEKKEDDKNEGDDNKKEDEKKNEEDINEKKEEEEENNEKKDEEKNDAKNETNDENEVVKSFIGQHRPAGTEISEVKEEVQEQKKDNINDSEKPVAEEDAKKEENSLSSFSDVKTETETKSISPEKQEEKETVPTSESSDSTKLEREKEETEAEPQQESQEHVINKSIEKKNYPELSKALCDFIQITPKEDINLDSLLDDLHNFSTTSQTPPSPSTNVRKQRSVAMRYEEDENSDEEKVRAFGSSKPDENGIAYNVLYKSDPNKECHSRVYAERTLDEFDVAETK